MSSSMLKSTTHEMLTDFHFLCVCPSVWLIFLGFCSGRYFSLVYVKSAFRFGKRFDVALLAQSIVMFICMIFMLEIAVRMNKKHTPKAQRKSILREFFSVIYYSRKRFSYGKVFSSFY